MVVGVAALRVRDRHLAQELGQLAVAPGRQDQMPVVEHQAIGEQAHRLPVLSLSNAFSKAA